MLLLLSLLLGLHLICMNVASAGPLVAAWLDWRAGRGDRGALRAARWLAILSLLLLLIGMLLGIAQGLLLYDLGRLMRDVFGRLAYKLHWGIWELGFSLALMIAYALWWRLRPEAGTAARVTRSLLALLASLNLLYHFPPLFTIAAQVATELNSHGGLIDAAEFRRRMLAPDVLAKWIHFTLASFAACGAALMLLAARWQRPGGAETLQREAQRLALFGSRLALAASLLQVPVGVWLTTALPPGQQRLVMGEDFLATGLLGASVLLALGLLHHLASAAVGQTDRRTLHRGVLLMVLTILLMSGVLASLRPRVTTPATFQARSNFPNSPWG